MKPDSVDPPTDSDGCHRLTTYRKLRIAWSVVWGLAAVLLIVLWVRSYRIQDTAYIGWSGLPYNVVFVSSEGRLSVAIRDYDMHPGITARRLSYTHQRDVIGPNYLRLDRDCEGRLPGRRWFTIRPQDHQFEVLIPMWFPPAFSGGLAVVLWMRWSRRFSLRTILLIATTLVAVVLGAIAWL